MMRTRLLCLLALGFLGLFATTTARAQFLFATNNGSLTITGYTGPGGNVIIPSSANGYPVTSIGDYAFQLIGIRINSLTGPPIITNVVVPGSVTNIGMYVFSGCTGMVGVSLTNGLTTLGDGAFYGCTALLHVAIPGTVASFGDAVFDGCTNLLSVTMTNGLAGIGTEAFYGCTGLRRVTIPGSATNIGYFAFTGCTDLTNVTITAGVTSIGYGAFLNCAKLTSVVIPKSVTNIESGPVLPVGGGIAPFPGGAPISPPHAPVRSLAVGGRPNLVVAPVVGSALFEGCSSLTNISVDALNPVFASVAGVLFNRSLTTLIEYPGGRTGSYSIPGSVSSIGEQAFESCLKLTGVTIPNTVTSIGNDAFFQCVKLSGISIPNSVTSIGAAAFQSCSNLISAIIPVGVTNIGVLPFANCPAMVGISVAAANPNYTGNSGILFNKKSTTLLECPGGKTGSFAIPLSVTNISPSAFSGCAKLSAVTIPNRITSIGPSTFAGCASLTSMVIPNSVSDVGFDSFFGCTSLATVTIGSGVTNPPTPEFAYGYSENIFFAECPKLASIAVDPKNACYSSTNGVLFDKNKTTLLQYPPGKSGSYTIPNTVNNIAEAAFENCAHLTGVTIPGSVTNISDSAFEGCIALKSVTLPNSVAIIGGEEFAGCTSLTNVIFGTGLDSLGYDLFDDCTNLTSVLFIGNAPGGFYFGPFASPPPTIYYLAGTGGWNWFLSLEGVPAVMLNAPNPNGSLEVDINPSEAGGDGACWQVDGGLPQSGGAAVVGLSVGQHTVSFSGLDGWLTPSSQTVLVASNATAYAQGWYAKTGSSAFVCATNPDNTLTIVGYDGPGGNVVIPGTINGMIVTSIDYGAFQNFGLLTNLTISGSVTNIGSTAFYSCYNLASVTITSDIINIGEGAFEYCNNLTNLEILSGTPAIGDYAFYGCSSLPGVSLPGGAVSIGYAAFSSCSSLASMAIPGSIGQIGDEAFSHCPNLTSLTISNGVVGIGNDVFDSCYNLANVVIPASVASIGDYAFAACISLTSMAIPATVTNLGSFVFVTCVALTNVSVDAFNPNYTSVNGVVFNHGMTAVLMCPEGLAGSYNIPGSVVNIADGAFDGCSKLLNITIPNGVTNIGNFAFQTCFQMPAVTLPSGLISIGSNAFNSCSGLKTVAIPVSVANIGEDAFHDCYSLTNITVDALNSAYASAGGVLFDKSSHRLACCPGGMRGNYVIPGTVFSVGHDAFADCDLLTGVTIPNSVTSIGPQAFEGCTGLGSVVIPGSVANLGAISFSDCGITNVTMEYGVTDIPDSTFSDCFNLTSVSLPDSLTDIGPYAFYFCGNLATIVIPGSVRSIGSAAFDGCNKLKGIFFGGNAPPVSDFEFVDLSAIAFYLPGTSGWGANFGSLPTALWYQPNPMILSGGGDVGVQGNRFGFTISWATNTSVVVEACSNLANPVWKPVQTNLMVNGTNYFSDAKWTNYPGRYYRVRTQ